MDPNSDQRWNEHDPGSDEYRGNVQPEIYTGWQHDGDADASDSGIPDDEPSEFYH